MAWSYDPVGRITEVAAPQGTVAYTYDAAGRRSTMTQPEGTSGYAYDAAWRLTGLTDFAANVFIFGYDPDGRLTSVERPNGVDTAQSYDAAGRLSRIDHVGPGGPIEFYDYTLDADSNRTAMTSIAGAEIYTINAINQLTDVAYPNGDTQSYTYDPAGNRLTDTLNGTTTNYSYDNASQLTTSAATLTPTTLPGTGRQAGTDTYTWDWAGRLASTTVGGQTSTYAYDGDGVRVSATTGPSTSDYVWDRTGGLETLISDGSTGYVHADGQVLTQTATSTDYLLPDAVDSIRAVTNRPWSPSRQKQGRPCLLRSDASPPRRTGWQWSLRSFPGRRC